MTHPAGEVGGETNTEVTATEAFEQMAEDKIGAYPGDPMGRVRASEEAWKRGIPGIRYLDQGSRSAGQGSRNLVVFDDSLIDILNKY